MKLPQQTVLTRSHWLKYSLISVLFTVLLALHTSSATEGGVYIQLFKLQPVAKKTDSYQIRAYKAQLNIKYKITEHLHQALLNGVTLKANLEFYYHQPDNWFWSKKERLSDLNFQIKYHALSRHYLISRNDTNEHWNFGNLPAALRKMGEIRNFKLPHLEKRKEEDDNYITAIAYFEPSNIKLPLRIQSLVNDKYSLSSEEVRWPLP